MSSRVIRTRAVVLGLVLGLGVCAVTPLNNLYYGATPLGGGHFPLAPFFLLAWLTVLAAGLGRLFRGRAILTGTDLMIGLAFGAIYVLFPVISGLIFTEPVSLLPIPWADFTRNTEGWLPAVATGIQFDLGLVFTGMPAMNRNPTTLRSWPCATAAG